MLACCPTHLSHAVQYEARLFKLLDDYDKAFMFNADNVGSKQFMDIRAVRPCLPSRSVFCCPPGVAASPCRYRSTGTV